MEWVRVKSEGNKQAGRARQVFSQRMSRNIRVGSLETIVQIRNGESHFMDKLGRDIGFTWRFCQTPEAETGGQIVEARCGIELAETMLKMHQSSCKACRRVIDPNYTRRKRSDAKKPERVAFTPGPKSWDINVTQEEIDAVIDESESTPPKNFSDHLQEMFDEVVDEVVDSTPTTLAALVLEMTRQRDHALNLAAEYDTVIAAAQGIDSETARIKEIEEQMEAHRQALAAFIAPKDATA
jgi:hypothetical protein